MSRGSLASTRAISSRLRPGVPRLRARLIGLAAEADEVDDLAAPARAHRARLGWRRKAPTITFSRMVMSSKVAGTWKVRPMPSRACASGEASVTSRPAKTMRPLVGSEIAGEAIEEGRLAGAVGADQADDLALVDDEVGARDSAQKLPKALRDVLAPQAAWRRLPARCARGDALPQLEQPAGLEARDDRMMPP